jgi:predicted PurR-regulated permease PerM
VISASVYGVIVISAIQGFLGGLAFAVLRIPSPLLWGVVMFLLSMIPMAGAAIVWGPAALYLFFTGHWIKAILLVIWGGGVIGMIDNVLRPRLVGERTKLHELLIFFSVLGGLQVFGVLGLVVGPVVFAIALALLEIFRQSEAQREAERIAAATTTTTMSLPAPGTPAPADGNDAAVSLPAASPVLVSVHRSQPNYPAKKRPKRRR